MIKNILFDFGGVIITLDQRQAIARFEALGLADAATRLDAYTQTGIFGSLERGGITAEQFCDELGLLCGRKLTWQECLHAWLGYRKELPPYSIDALVRLRGQGYRIILVSNTNPFMSSWFESPEFDGRGHSIHHYFDATYMSYKLRAMKPEPEFFSQVLAAEKIDPAESLFVDDGQRNTQAAARMGIHTLLVENGRDWTDDLNLKLQILNTPQ